jgi:hypothetical protein
VADALAKRPDRLTEIRQRLESIYENDLKDVELAKWMFHSDAELQSAGLTAPQIARVRAWEVPRKEVAAGLAMASSRLEALARESPKGPTLNIERAVIQVPAPEIQAKRIAEAVIIDVEPNK